MNYQCHSEVAKLLEQFRNKQIHASHSGRELMRILIQVALDSPVGSITQQVNLAISQILTFLPAYAPPLNVIHRISVTIEEAVAQGLNDQELRVLLQAQGEKYNRWSLEARQSIAAFTFNLIPNHTNIFTFTLSETVMYVLRENWRLGKRFQVHVTESRPNNDGLETARRLAEDGVPVSVSIDSNMAGLITQADMLLSGAEAILEDGSAVCKVGTFLAALAAREYRKPLYVLVDTMKFNVSSLYGLDLRFDPLNPGDLYSGLDGYSKFSTVPPNVTVTGSLFDRTPPSLIRGIVTEQGVFSPQSCVVLMSQKPYSQEFLSKLYNRVKI